MESKRMKNWWKILAVILVLYAYTMGLLGKVPTLPILHESIRNVYYHVPMWFTMMFLMIISLTGSIRYLMHGKWSDDNLAEGSVKTGMLFGFLGLITGMIWARFTWGAWWVNDTKLNGAAITVLIYLAYIILRHSIDDEKKRGKAAAVYNIFAFVMMMVFLMILPRITDTLHPGNGGNPAFGQYDMNNNMRLVFYPAIIGWILMGLWLLQVRRRADLINFKHENDD